VTAIKEALARITAILELTTDTSKSVEPEPAPPRIVPLEEIYADDPLFNPAKRQPPEPTPPREPPTRKRWWSLVK
jgi:hypothetical protein